MARLRLLRLLLLLILLLPSPPVRASGLQEVLDRCLPQVERALGQRFRQPPAIRESSREELARLLVAELLPQLRVQLPDGDPEQVRRASEVAAEAYSRVLVGKYDPAAHTILILRDNLARLPPSGGADGPSTEDLVRAVVIHELVHAADEEAVGAVSAAASCRTTAEIEVWNAVLEGHAQFVTRKVLLQQGEGPLFDAVETQITELPPGLGEGERYLVNLLMHSMKFAYRDGRRFFEALPEARHSEVFARPPASKSVILHPERYDQPAKETRQADLDPLFARMQRDFAGWQARRVEGDESLLRAVFADLVEPSRVEAVLSRVRGAQQLILRPTQGEDSLVVFAAYETDGPAAAADLLDLQEALSRAKDERMTEGAFRILEAEYRPVEAPGLDRAFAFHKTVEVEGSRVAVSSAIGISGPWCLEVLLSGGAGRDPVADLEAMAEQLPQGGSGAPARRLPAPDGAP